MEQARKNPGRIKASAQSKSPLDRIEQDHLSIYLTNNSVM